MNNKLVDKISRAAEKKRLVENIVSLGLLQSANYILPLLTVPYLVRTLGADYFGLLAFATATVMYISLLCDYGFNLSATRQVSINRENIQSVNEIFGSVMAIKSMLLVVGFIILFLLVTLVGKFNEHRMVYLITFGGVVGQVLFPVWLFQGMEMMKHIAYVNVFSKALFTLFIFIFVNAESDFILVPLFTSLGSIFAGLWSLHVVLNKMGCKFIWPRLDQIKFQLWDGWHVFFSSIAISFYTISTTFILGLLTNNAAVGQFAAVDKIIQAIKGVYQPVAQAVYPMVGRKFHDNKIAALNFIKKLSILVALVMSLLSGMLYFFSDSIVSLILGGQFSDAGTLLKIMSPLPLIVALSNILGIQVMLNLGLKLAFSRILTVAALFGITSTLFLVPIFQEKGTAITLLCVELFVTCSMFFYLRRHFKLTITH